MFYLLQTIRVTSVWVFAKFLLCHLDILLIQNTTFIIHFFENGRYFGSGTWHKSCWECYLAENKTSWFNEGEKQNFYWSERSHEKDAYPLSQETTSCLVMRKQSALLDLVTLLVFLKVVYQKNSLYGESIPRIGNVDWTILSFRRCCKQRCAWTHGLDFEQRSAQTQTLDFGTQSTNLPDLTISPSPSCDGDQLHVFSKQLTSYVKICCTARSAQCVEFQHKYDMCEAF